MKILVTILLMLLILNILSLKIEKLRGLLTFVWLVPTIIVLIVLVTWNNFVDARDWDLMLWNEGDYLNIEGIALATSSIILVSALAILVL